MKKIGINALRFFVFYFSAIVYIVELATIYSLIVNPYIYKLIAVVLIPYALPLATFRIFNYFKPLKEGISIIDGDSYSPWFASYRFQFIYFHFPFLEGALRSIPKLFNIWLRMWGSKIGDKVYWAGDATVTDRSHLEIGNKVFIGNLVYLSSHVADPRNERFLLYFRKIKIGDNCFIGAGSRMGPGATVADNSKLPLMTDLYVNEKFPKVSKESKQTEEKSTKAKPESATL